MSELRKLCIYHGNCADGFAAATVVRRSIGVDNVDFYAGVHNESPPDVTGLDVIIVDFSYKRDVLLLMAEKAKTILILDHHKSAEKDLIDLPKNVEAKFDMDKSGAMLAWDYFFKGKEAPKIICHVEDRDLWRFNLEGTREIQACLFSYPYDFDIWDRFIFSVADIEGMIKQGEAIERKHFKDVKEFIAVGAYRTNIAGYDVPVLNMPYFFVSDAAHIMGEGEFFAACYWDIPGFRVFGLRSASDGIDVSDIAVKFGGGGHKHAAGFRLSLDVLDSLSSPHKENK